MPSELGMALSYATMLRFPDENEMSVEDTCWIAVVSAVLAVPVYFPACIREVAGMLATTLMPWTQDVLVLKHTTAEQTEAIEKAAAAERLRQQHIVRAEKAHEW